MPLEYIVSNALTPPQVPLSHAVKVGGLLFVSGIHPYTADRQIVRGDFDAQMHQVMDNMAAVLSDGGSSFDRVVKTTVILRRMSDFAAMNKIYGQFFAPGRCPARTTIQSELGRDDMLLEIECVAETSAG